MADENSKHKKPHEVGHKTEQKPEKKLDFKTKFKIQLKKQLMQAKQQLDADSKHFWTQADKIDMDGQIIESTPELKSVGVGRKYLPGMDAAGEAMTQDTDMIRDDIKTIRNLKKALADLDKEKPVAKKAGVSGVHDVHPAQHGKHIPTVVAEKHPVHQKTVRH